MDERRKISDTHQAQRDAMPRAPRPRLAASIALLRQHEDKLQVLMGQRSKRHDFMPSVYVFPGGRVDRGDSFTKVAGQAPHRTTRFLDAAMPSARARACLVAAVRETEEEVGLSLMTDSRPDLTGIEIFGRAVTPPYRPKRFDTWFFFKVLQGDQAHQSFGDSIELLNVDWFDFDEALDLNLHIITKVMVEQLRRVSRLTPLPDHIIQSVFRYGKFDTTPLSL